MTTTTPLALSELANIGTAAACVIIPTEFKMAIGALGSDFNRDQPAREAFTKAILDAIGYKLPVDPEREAYDKWASQEGPIAGLFEAFKAGRAMLRESMEKQRHSALDEIIPQTAKQPKNNGWIPWSGGECPVEVSQRVEVQYCGLEITEIACAQIFRWNHAGKPSDIIAYKLVTP